MNLKISKAKAVYCNLAESVDKSIVFVHDYLNRPKLYQNLSYKIRIYRTNSFIFSTLRCGSAASIKLTQSLHL